MQPLRTLHYNSTGKRPLLLFVVTFALALLLTIPASQTAVAAQLVHRSLLINSASAGSTTQHTISFSYASSAVSIGSVVFEYCTSPLLALACVAPSGIDATNASLTQQTGETGYFVLAAQTNKVTLTRAPAAVPNPSQYTFDSIVNPTVPGTFFVRITTYQTLDGTGPYTDFGAVVNAITDGLSVSSEVPPYLKFCVGLAISADCSTTGDNVLDFGEMNKNTTSSGTSQMTAATNAESGLAIAVHGKTLTSGNHVIPALTTPTVSAPGNAQFGINIRANTNPIVGQDPSGPGLANPTPKYGTPNLFAFGDGDTVATSQAITDSRTFTVSYMANISPNLTPGVYTATLTYICTATF